MFETLYNVHLLDNKIDRQIARERETEMQKEILEVSESPASEDLGERGGKPLYLLDNIIDRQLNRQKEIQRERQEVGKNSAPSVYQGELGQDTVQCAPPR